MPDSKKSNIVAVDLFCGIGGLTYGLNKASINVVAGVDNDESCRFAYEKNCKAQFIHKDIQKLRYKDIAYLFDGADITMLAGCAPCQPFSALTAKQSGPDKRWSLLEEMSRLVKEGEPNIVSMENVPRLVHQKPFRDFVKALKKQGYSVDHDLVQCADFGVPQNRRRLVLLASKKLPSVELRADFSAFTVQKKKTVSSAIQKLPHIDHGKAHADDPMHVSSSLADINLKRIRASQPGGNWRSWDNQLLPECYRKPSGQSFTSVYGRMSWDKPSPTLTTQFYRYGTGRFGHPEQDRGLSLREGAILQTFPKDFVFLKEK